MKSKKQLIVLTVQLTDDGGQYPLDTLVQEAEKLRELLFNHPRVEVVVIDKVEQFNP